MNNTNLELENQQLKQQLAELSKFKHERQGNNKKQTLDQISTPAHLSEFMKDLLSKDNEENKIIIDIACGAGSLLIPWKDTNALLVGADLDEEALELCKTNLPHTILFKHNSLECPTPCEIKEHLFYQGTDYQQIKEFAGEKIFVLNPPFSLTNKMVSQVLILAKKSMNKLALILPNAFETANKFKKLRQHIFTNFYVENVVVLPVHTFQPYVEIHTIILYLTAKKEQKHFWHFEVKNDGYTQNKQRVKKPGENDFDIFWKFQKVNEQEKIKGGFRQLEIKKIEQQNYETNPRWYRDFSYLWTITPDEQEKIKREELEHIKSSIEHFKESIKMQTDYLANLYQKQEELENYFQQQKQRISGMVNTTATRNTENV